MKKIVSLLIILTLAFSLFACGDTPPVNPSPDDTPVADADSVINIGYFAGTTGIGMAKMINDASAKYTFTKYSGPDTIIPAFARGEIDIAALPTNAAPNVYNATNGMAQLLAINTRGVLYVCTNGETVSSLADLSGKTVYVPENAPKLVLEYVLREAGVENVTLSMEYNLDTLPTALAQGNVSIALLPEPKVTVANNLHRQWLNAQTTPTENTFAISLNISEEWDKVSDNALVQGCVIVNKTFASQNPGLMESFLSDYRASIEYIKNSENLDSASSMVANAEILPNVTVAKAAIPRSNITYLDGADMKQAALGFFSALSIQAPSDDFFYPGADASQE